MSNVQFIKHKKSSLSEEYKKYLADGAKPKNNFSNPLNLFDDSNEVDRLWLIKARKYISKVG